MLFLAFCHLANLDLVGNLSTKVQCQHLENLGASRLSIKKFFMLRNLSKNHSPGSSDNCYI